MNNMNAAELEQRKRRVCITRVTNLLQYMVEKKKEIYFEPLINEVMKTLNISERVAKEYIKIGLYAVGLTKEDIQWPDRRFKKTSLNENQKTLPIRMEDIE